MGNYFGYGDSAIKVDEVYSLHLCEIPYKDHSDPGIGPSQEAVDHVKSLLTVKPGHPEKLDLDTQNTNKIVLCNTDMINTYDDILFLNLYLTTQNNAAYVASQIVDSVHQEYEYTMKHDETDSAGITEIPYIGNVMVHGTSYPVYEVKVHLPRVS